MVRRPARKSKSPERFAVQPSSSNILKTVYRLHVIPCSFMAKKDCPLRTFYMKLSRKEPVWRDQETTKPPAARRLCLNSGDVHSSSARSTSHENQEYDCQLQRDRDVPDRASHALPHTPQESSGPCSVCFPEDPTPNRTVLLPMSQAVSIAAVALLFSPRTQHARIYNRAVPLGCAQERCFASSLPPLSR